MRLSSGAWTGRSGGDTSRQESVDATEAPPAGSALEPTWMRALPLAELEREVLRPGSEPVPAFVAFYREGHWLGRAWGEGDTLALALSRAAAEAERTGYGLAPTEAIVVIPGAIVPLHQQNKDRVLSDVHRGVYGGGIWHGNRRLFISPTDCIARNQPLGVLLSRLAEACGQDEAEAMALGRAFSFPSRQFHVALTPPGSVTPLLRGSPVVSLRGVVRPRVERFERDLSGWMQRHVREDGRMTYLYLPSKGAEVLDNNMVRQFMATICLGRIAERDTILSAQTGVSSPGLSGERSPREVADLNLRYNLRQFYREEGRLGFVEHDGEVYLGSAALALIAIIESPLRAEFAREEAGLRATINSLSHVDGSFTTWIRPATRTDNQNFFPGETLLAWAFLHRRGEDDTLRERILRSYRYYRTWHLEHRLPAFIPWHTQAYYQLLEVHDDPELRDWVFEMNDWLLGMQARSKQVYDDTEGRFYDPQRPYGPPHASSTGVYLEGLVDAFALARAVRDQRRMRAYRRAIWLGLRSALQLQFNEESELFYVARRGLVRGGIRTTVYNNVIRVDNVQHVLMAVQKILRLFGPEDFNPY